MSRRSSRLASGGYYNSDEESDSSSVTTISYRENPVKVFKKKAGTRKAGSRTSSRANSNASSASPETPDQYEALTPPPSSSQTPVSMRTVPYPGSAPTPRPALTPACCPSSRAALHFRPSQTDSSGYSSSEGVSRKPPPAADQPSTAGLRRRVSGVVHSLTESASSAAAAAHSKILHLTAFVGSPSFRRRAKQAGAVVLLLLVFLLCLWFLLPFFISSISHLTSTKTVPQTEAQSKPAVPPLPLRPLPPAPPPQPDSSALQLDAAIISAAVEAKMERLLAELQLKQEHLASQMKTTLQRDLQDVKASLEAEESSRWMQLQQEVSGLGLQVEELRSDGRSDAAALQLKIQTLEAQSAQLSQDLSSVQQRPPPAPCPAPVPTPQRLTPELQQAMEKWFAERVKEQDAIRLAEQGHCADCGRPMADKMADFALETQGASVVSTRCSETYRIRSACVTLFGFPLWYPSESPRTVIQGFPVLLPGKCWAFHGVRGTLLISLSHPVRISHVTLDHLPRYNSPTGRIDSAPRDFQVYGLRNDTEEGTLLGGFTYDEHGPSTQTFQLPNPSDVLFRLVELRVLTNWGHMEYTCVYRFRVHGKMASTS